MAEKDSKSPTEDKGKDSKSKICYNCRKKGHMVRQCNSSLMCQDHTMQKAGVCRKGLVEGRAVSDIILDTGCTKSIVRSDLVSTEAVARANQAVRIPWAHGDTVLYPLASISVEVDGL